MPVYSYKTSGTCSKMIDVELDGNVVKNIQFYGGCNGNTQGIAKLVPGMTVEEVEAKLTGVRCGARATSCPDQLAKAVRAAYNAQV